MSTFSVTLSIYTDTSTTEIYTLSLHDALPIWSRRPAPLRRSWPRRTLVEGGLDAVGLGLCQQALMLDEGSPDRKSTRLNSSHRTISYAVFCLKKKKKKKNKSKRIKDEKVKLEI